MPFAAASTPCTFIPGREKRQWRFLLHIFSSVITGFDSHEADTAAVDADKTVLGGYITFNVTCGQPHLGNFRRAKVEPAWCLFYL